MQQSIIHIALLVRDYDEAIAFYVDKLKCTRDVPSAVCQDGYAARPLRAGCVDVDHAFYGR